ncbi:MAG: OsmC family protein [Verrucomicrobiae bacterium]|nr:OsmC family protein [Verrucomicrobiae bacterium]
MADFPQADAVFEGGDMDCGSGLALLIRQEMLKLPVGGVLELRSREPTVQGDLPPWAAMTGHAYLGTEDVAEGSWRHFIRCGATPDADALEQDKAKARDYAWRARARSTAPREATVYARNFSWKLGQPASFEEKDAHPSAVEALLGALASDVMNGFATQCGQRGLGVDELEANVSGRLTNVLAHVAMEEGDPSFSKIELTVFVTSPAAGADLRTAFDETLRRSPLFATLQKACEATARIAVI